MTDRPTSEDGRRGLCRAIRLVLDALPGTVIQLDTTEPDWEDQP